MYGLFWQGGDGTRYMVSDDPFDFRNGEAYRLATSYLHRSGIVLY